MRALGLFGFLGVSFAALVAMDKITRPIVVKQTEQVCCLFACFWVRVLDNRSYAANFFRWCKMSSYLNHRDA